MPTAIRKLLLFAVSFAAVNCLLALAWSAFVTDKLYHCTDAIGIFDYLTPGNWVHGEVATVPEITPSQDMSGPDTIKEGWTQGDLLLLWLAFQTTAVTTGLFACCKIPPQSMVRKCCLTEP